MTGDETMICHICQTPISDEYHTSPGGEPVHTGECFRQAHAPILDPDLEPDPDSRADPTADADQPETIEDVPDSALLEPEEVAANLRDYLVVLDAEMLMAEQLAHALENGDLTPRAMIDAMPEPSPLEAWDEGRYDEFPPEHYHISLPEDGGGASDQ